MADGRILIDTKIDTKGVVDGTDKVIAAARRMATQVDGLSNSVKTAFSRQADAIQKASRVYVEQGEKIDGMKRKLEELKSQEVPTEQYKNVEGEIQKAESALDKLIEKQIRFAETGGNTKSRTFKQMEYDIEKARQKLDELRATKEEMETSGTAYTPGTDANAQQIADLEAKITSEKQKQEEMGRSLETSYESLRAKVEQYGEAMSGTASETGKAAQIAGFLQSSLNGLQTVFSKNAWATVAKFSLSAISSKLKEIVKSAYKASISLAQLAGSKITGGLKKIASGIFGINKAANKSTTSFGGSLKTILKYSFGIRSLYALVNKLRSALTEGMKNLAQYSGKTNETLSGLMSSLSQCKNALATAFDPILQAIAPALNYMINLVTAAATAIAQLIAILTGKGTFIKATKVQKDYAASLKSTGGAAKGAGEDAEGALASFDKLNVIADDASKGGGGGAGGGGISPADMFETAEVSDSFKGIGNILSDLFRPFKEAWNRDGKSVVEAAKYALSSMGELAKSVGRSFMEVWTNGTGTKVVSEFLQISRNLLLIIGNIATRLNDAWNQNKVGTRIIQGIFNIFLSVLDTINRITSSTERWSRTLDFTPLLESVSRMLEALKPLTDTVGKGLEWLWNKILLPFSKWTIEDAVPAFLNMLSGAIDALNAAIVAFEPVGTWLWDNFLSPLGEWAGKVFISAMEKITELLEDFSFWISENQDTVTKFGTIVAGLATVFGAVSLAIGGVNAIIPILSTAVSGLASVITGPVGIVAALAAIVTAADKAEQMIESFKSILNGLIDFIAGVFSGDWERAWSGIEGIVSGIVDSIITLIESVITVIDKLIRKADEMTEIEENTSRRSVNIKKSAYSIQTPRQTFSMRASAEPVHLPRLASGTVVPPRAGEFTAILGDNNRETEVVSPLSTMKQAMLEALAQAGGTGGRNITAKIYLDRRELGRSMVEFIREEKDRTGTNPLLV